MARAHAWPIPPAPPVITTTSSALMAFLRPVPHARVSPLTSEPFDDHRVGHPAALAHRLQAVPAAGGLEVVQQGAEQPGTGGAERVAEGDCPAPRVQLGRIRV